MVNALPLGYRYVHASDRELDALLRGEHVDREVGTTFVAAGPLHVGETGVLVERGVSSVAPVRPVALVAHEQDIRRLCGRYAQLRADLSPLTAWCHLLTPNLLGDIGDVAHAPRFQETEAAWSGLVVAEAMLLARKPVAEIRIGACLASATYAVGRAKGLWRDLLVGSIVERFETANRLFRGRGASTQGRTRTCRVRSAFEPIWSCLSALTTNSLESDDEKLRPLIVALEGLRKARPGDGSSEAELFVRPLLEAAPESKAFVRLAEMTPETRLGLFDELVRTFRETDASAVLRYNALALTLGYLATVAAGGAASLSLVDEYAEKWPELTGWAYVAGSIRETVTWTSGFDGLGRLVARELRRRLRLDEAPMCDFALDEAVVLTDAQLKDPLVYLRIKQARMLSVALYPGVNVAVPIVETTAREKEEARQERQSQGGEVAVDPEGSLEVLAGALWRYIQPLVVREMAQHAAAEGRGGSGRGRRRASSSQLPLKSSKK